MKYPPPYTELAWLCVCGSYNPVALVRCPHCNRLIAPKEGDEDPKGGKGMRSQFSGNIYGIKFYPFALTPAQIYSEYEATRLLYLKWWQWIIYWTRLTWLILLGQRKWIEKSQTMLERFEAGRNKGVEKDGK